MKTMKLIKPKKTIWAQAALAFLVTGNLWAQDIGGQSVTTQVVNHLREHLKSSYTMWVTGPTVEHMDGQDGKGANLTLNQFAMIGYKISPKWSIATTQYWTNTVNSESKGERSTKFMDPYLTVSNSSLLKSEKYGANLAAYLRYYMPFSHESADNVGLEKDQKNGKLRLKIEPSKDFADGVINLAMPIFLIKPLRGAKPNEGLAKQNDLIFWIYPQATFNIHKKFQPYLAYSNYMKHFIDKNRNYQGRWNRFNELHNLELGFNWQPITGLNVNPYVEYGPDFVPRKSSVGLVAEYAFL